MKKNESNILLKKNNRKLLTKYKILELEITEIIRKIFDEKNREC